MRHTRSRCFWQTRLFTWRNSCRKVKKKKEREYVVSWARGCRLLLACRSSGAVLRRRRRRKKNPERVVARGVPQRPNDGPAFVVAAFCGAQPAAPTLQGQQCSEVTVVTGKNAASARKAPIYLGRRRDTAENQEVPSHETSNVD
jgi:hypothetical protein